MIFSIISFALVVLSILLKDRKKSLATQSASCFFEAVYAFTIAAYTSCVLNLVNFLRTWLFIRKEKFSKAAYMLILIIFESVIVINCGLTWAGMISLLPTVGSIIRTYCLWQSDMKLVRISGITSGLLFTLYYIAYRGWFMVLGYSLLFIAGIYAVWKNDIAPRRKSES